MIKLIALDLDGTLLDPSGRITEPSRQAVARAQARGVHVVLNTGRSIQEALWLARQAGICGLVAALGVVFPSLIIITIIAAFLTNFAEIPVVRHALAGINAAVVALIGVSVLKLGKSTLKNAPSVCIFLAVLVLSELGSLLGLPTDTPAGKALDILSSPVTLVILAGVTGVLLARCSGSRKGGEGK